MIFQNQPTRLLSLLGAVAIGVVGQYVLGPKRTAPAQISAPIISVQSLGELVTLQVNYADVIEFTQSRTFDVPWGDWGLSIGGTKVLLVARGNCTLATNLELAKPENIDEPDRTLTIALPKPRTLSATVDHSSKEKGGSYLYAVTSQGIEPIIPGGSNAPVAIEKAFRLAQANIARACVGPKMLSTAKENAESILNATLRHSGWKIKYEWR